MLVYIPSIYTSTMDPSWESEDALYWLLPRGYFDGPFSPKNLSTSKPQGDAAQGCSTVVPMYRYTDHEAYNVRPPFDT